MILVKCGQDVGTGEGGCLLRRRRYARITAVVRTRVVRPTSACIPGPSSPPPRGAAQMDLSPQNPKVWRLPKISRTAPNRNDRVRRQ